MTMSSTEYKELNSRLKQVESSLQNNTRLTQQVKDDTAGLVAFFQNAEGAFKALEFLGKVAKPIAWLGVMGGLVYGAFKAYLSHLK